MNTSTVVYIANMFFSYIGGCSGRRLSKAGQEGHLLCVPFNEEVSILLTFNDKLKQWVLVAERDVSFVPERIRDQLLEKLMDTATHSRVDESLIVGLTASQKISVSKILVDVSVNKIIINAIKRIMSVIMAEKNENIFEGASTIDC